MSIFLAKGGINDTFSFAEGFNFISRQMVITLNYPSNFLSFFPLFSQPPLHFSSLILGVHLFFSFSRRRKRIRVSLSSGYYSSEARCQDGTSSLWDSGSCSCNSSWGLRLQSTCTGPWTDSQQRNSIECACWGLDNE